MKAEQSVPKSRTYVAILSELDLQQNKKTITIDVDGKTYSLKNPDRLPGVESQFLLAEEIYDDIRESETDIFHIAKHTGFKAQNIEKCKDHIFNNIHKLDRYEPIEYKRYDATLHQALAWKRLVNGDYTLSDITWLKHEFAERHHEKKYNSGYSEAHNRAEKCYSGAPWEMDVNK